MAEIKVRNEKLYAFLAHYYKRVKICNAGMPYQYRAARDVNTGKKTIRRISSGEEYAICCPVCKETRFRLSVNHMFGELVDGVRIFPAHCWNEECSVVKILTDLYEEFCDIPEDELGVSKGIASVIAPTFSLEEVAKECTENLLKLDGIVRVDTLPEDHPAVRYLRNRNFDPKVLGPLRGIGYCDNDQYKARQAHKRITIPILYKGRYVGWQARAIPGWTKLTLDPRKEGKAWPYQEPKYWTSPGTRKSFFLYGYDQALAFDTVLVSEGPTDAWRAGACGMAILGRMLSVYQMKMLADVWGQRDGSIILIGDPGFEDDWQRNFDRLQCEVGEARKVKLVLPKDCDPGDMTEERLERIKGEA